METKKKEPKTAKKENLQSVADMFKPKTGKPFVAPRTVEAKITSGESKISEVIDLTKSDDELPSPTPTQEVSNTPPMELTRTLIQASENLSESEEEYPIHWEPETGRVKKNPKYQKWEEESTEDEEEIEDLEDLEEEDEEDEEDTRRRIQNLELITPILDEAGFVPLTNQKDIFKALEKKHDLLLCCGMIFAVPRARLNMQSSSLKKLLRPGTYTFKDISNLITRLPLQDFVPYYPGGTLNQDEVRVIVLANTAVNQRPALLDLGNTVLGRNRSEPSMSEESPSNRLKTSSSNIPPRKKLRRTISNFGYDTTEPSKGSEH